MTAVSAPAAAAGPLRHVEHVMGTVFSFVVRDAGPGVPAGLAAAVARLHQLDAEFSTYRPDSPISRLGRGEVTLDECRPEIAEVLARCEEVAGQTDGWFSAYPGGVLDPSGWVKGWAIDEASRILTEAGSGHHCVSGGGDVQTAGESAPGRGWRIGVADPVRAGELATVVLGRGVCVATSGVAERGAHIIDPHSGKPAEGLLSVTLVSGLDRIALTDAWATAVFAMGPVLGLEWAERRDGVEAMAVLSDGIQVRTSGFSRFSRVP